MITSYEDVGDAVLHLPKAHQARLLAVVANEVAQQFTHHLRRIAAILAMSDKLNDHY